MKILIPASELEAVLDKLADDPHAGCLQAAAVAHDMLTDGWRCGGIWLRWHGEDPEYGTIELHWWTGCIGGVRTEVYVKRITFAHWGALV